MPQIAPNTWKAAYHYFWMRKYQDGHIEYLFNLETGEEALWGSKTPENLIQVGWLPMTPDLAGKIQRYGEFGSPVRDKPYIINLSPGDEPICFRDLGVFQGYEVRCMVCSTRYYSLEAPQVCPSCGATPTKVDSGKVMAPFDIRPASWEDAAYVLGVKGRFEIRFNSRGLLAH